MNERGFGRLTKRWGILCRRLPTSLIPKFASFYRIILAVDNAYAKPLWPVNEDDRSDLHLFASRSAEATNIVQDLVRSGDLHFTQLEEDTFVGAAPSDLNLKSLRRWNGGPFAIKLAPQYIAHARSTLKYYHAKKNEQDIYKITGWRSRFSKTKGRTVWIIFGGSIDATRCYCNCKCGTRTVGSCAHGVASMWLVLCLRKLVEDSSTSASNFSNVLDITDFAVKRRREKKGHYIPGAVADTIEFVRDDAGSDDELVEEPDKRDYEGAVVFDAVFIDAVVFDDDEGLSDDEEYEEYVDNED